MKIIYVTKKVYKFGNHTFCVQIQLKLQQQRKKIKLTLLHLNFNGDCTTPPHVITCIYYLWGL